MNWLSGHCDFKMTRRSICLLSLSLSLFFFFFFFIFGLVGILLLPLLLRSFPFRNSFLSEQELSLTELNFTHSQSVAQALDAWLKSEELEELEELEEWKRRQDFLLLRSKDGTRSGFMHLIQDLLLLPSSRQGDH